MARDPKFSITNSSLTVIIDGKTHTYEKGAPNFVGLRDALLNGQWAEVGNYLTVAKGIEQWAKGLFTAQGDIMSYQGDPLPSVLNSRILEMACKGEDATPILRFWERLVGCPEKGLPGNPSMRSVEQLWSFLDNKGIPIDQGGFILGYKGVDCNYKDMWTHKVDNHVGTHNKMPRNKVSDDPSVACHYGFHCGSLDYARGYASGNPIIIVRVDPADVVCIPFDCGCQKMRMCAYTVMSVYGGDRVTDYLPSTTMPAEPTVPVEDLVIREDYPDSAPDDEYEDAGLFNEDESEAPVVLDEGTTSTPTVATTKTQWKDTFDGLDEDALYEQGIVELRKYASHDLKIAGAFKIPGGKAALIEQILRVRGDRKKTTKKVKK